jgi:hypothetical protein
MAGVTLELLESVAITRTFPCWSGLDIMSSAGDEPLNRISQDLSHTIIKLSSTDIIIYYFIVIHSAC